MRHAVRPRAGPRRLFLVRSNRLNARNGIGRAAPQRLACREKNRSEVCLLFASVEYCEVKPVSEFLQTHGPGKLRHRPNPLQPSLSQTLPTFLYATARQKTAATFHSQNDFRAPTHNPIDRGLWATDAVGAQDDRSGPRGNLMLIRRIALVVLTMALGSTQATNAQATSTITGMQLQQWCSDPKPNGLDGLQCASFRLGFINGMNEA